MQQTLFYIFLVSIFGYIYPMQNLTSFEEERDFKIIKNIALEVEKSFDNVSDDQKILSFCFFNKKDYCPTYTNSTKLIRGFRLHRGRFWELLPKQINGLNFWLETPYGIWALGYISFNRARDADNFCKSLMMIFALKNADNDSSEADNYEVQKCHGISLLPTVIGSWESINCTDKAKRCYDFLEKTKDRENFFVIEEDSRTSN